MRPSRVSGVAWRDPRLTWLSVLLSVAATLFMELRAVEKSWTPEERAPEMEPPPAPAALLPEPSRPSARWVGVVNEELKESAMEPSSTAEKASVALATESAAGVAPAGAAVAGSPTTACSGGMQARARALGLNFEGFLPGAVQLNTHEPGPGMHVARWWGLGLQQKRAPPAPWAQRAPPLALKALAVEWSASLASATSRCCASDCI